MAGLASTDVVVSVLSKEEGGKTGRVQNLSLVFGDGSKTYPSGGVPLSKAALGCPNVVDMLEIHDAANANGYVYKVDLANLKIRIYQGDNDNAADAPLIELLTSIAPAAATLKVRAVGY